MILPASYGNGFAPRDGSPLYPELWRGCIFAAAPCIGPSGLTLRDWSGFCNHGTTSNASTWGPISGVMALNFTGSSSIDVGNITAFNFGTGQFSLSCWVLGGAADKIIAGKANFAGSDNGVQIFTRSVSGNPYAYWNGVAAQPIGANDGGWHHLCVTRASTSAGGLSVYYDGKLSLTATDARTLSNSSSFRLAVSSDGSGFFNGSIGAVIVYRSQLRENLVRLLATRQGIAYELAPRRRSSALVIAAFNRRRRLLLGAQS